MKLGTVRAAGSSRAAIFEQDHVAIIEQFADAGALLRAEDTGWEAARLASDGSDRRPFVEEDVLRPVITPGAIVCVGLNYRTHIEEMGRELPTNPTLFSKLARALTDPYANVALPSFSSQVDYEGELAVVIGRSGRDIPLAEAWSYVAGLSVLNDVTVRDYQRRTLQWFAGKTLQSSTPLGPWIVTADEVGPLDQLELSLKVNGEERQRARLDDLVFDVTALVSDLSQIVELSPGDVIATGTPGGVGEPQGLFLEAGDLVEVTIDRIGTIRNRFVAP